MLDSRLHLIGDGDLGLRRRQGVDPEDHGVLTGVVGPAVAAVGGVLGERRAVDLALGFATFDSLNLEERPAAVIDSEVKALLKSSQIEVTMPSEVLAPAAWVTRST